MQVLVDSKYNMIVAQAPKIVLGVYDETFEKWGLFDEDDRILMYVIDHEYTLYDDVVFPVDYVDGKYIFKDGKFILNEDWQPPLPSNEERIAELERQLANLNGDAVWDEMAVAIEEGVNEV